MAVLAPPPRMDAREQEMRITRQSSAMKREYILLGAMMNETRGKKLLERPVCGRLTAAPAESKCHREDENRSDDVRTPDRRGAHYITYMLIGCC